MHLPRAAAAQYRMVPIHRVPFNSAWKKQIMRPFFVCLFLFSFSHETPHV